MGSWHIIEHLTWTSQGKILRRNIIFVFLKDKQNLAIEWEDKEKVCFSIMSRFSVWERRWKMLPFIKRGRRSRTSLGMGCKCWVWGVRGMPKDRCPVGFDRIWTQQAYLPQKPSSSFWPSVALLSGLLYLSSVPLNCCARFHVHQPSLPLFKKKKKTLKENYQSQAF